MKSKVEYSETAYSNATDEDLVAIEKIFIEMHLIIRYYPSQNKKVVRGKIVPIEYNYGSEDI